MLDLPQVTLCAADTLHPDLAVRALLHCMGMARFARVVLFTDRRKLRVAHPGIEVVDVRIANRDEYSRFMLTGLTPQVHTSHVLIVQWDGWILNPAAWRDEFLAYDYIGATWPDAMRRPPGAAGSDPLLPSVGNGGFCLRSARLLRALEAPGMRLEHPEDKAICWYNRDRLVSEFGIRFAEPAVARRFSCERPWEDGCFGFHGVFNFHRAMAPDDLRAMIGWMPDDLRCHNETRKLIVELLDRHRYADAAPLIEARWRSGMRDLRTLRLRGRLAWGRWRAARGLVREVVDARPDVH